MSKANSFQRAVKGVEDRHDGADQCHWRWNLLPHESGPSMGVYDVRHRIKSALRFKVWTQPTPTGGMRIVVRQQPWLNIPDEERNLTLEPDPKQMVRMRLGDVAHVAVEKMCEDISVRKAMKPVAG